MISENYIKQTDVDSLNVKSAPNKLEGNAKENKKIFDRLPEFIAVKHNGLVTFVQEDIYTKDAVDARINARVFEISSSDMCKFTYDPDGDGKVLAADSADSADNALKLGGQLPEYYASASSAAAAQTTANAAMPKAGGVFTGDITATGTNRDTSCLRNTEVRITSPTGALQATNNIIMVRK